MRDTYSSLVAVLKVALPLVALGLMSMVFLISRSIDPERAVATASVDVEALVREPRISAARFAGVTDGNAALTVLADTARADPEDRFRLDLSALSGSLDTQAGQRTEFTARLGVLDQQQNRMVMEGDVTFHSAPGYVLPRERLTAALDRSGVVGEGDVRGRGPAGTVRADRVMLEPSGRGDGAYRLAFSGAVRLIYDPTQ